jgi:hypothetical protein
LGFVFLILFLSGQEIQEQAIAINVEVPVRVYDGNEFVDNLGIDDFELYEEAVLQKIEAIYLINKASIKRSEEKKEYSPKTSRTFFILFEITEYAPKILDATDYFIRNVVLPTDNLFLITPLRSYEIKNDILRTAPKSEIVRQLNGILRRDAWIGNSDYRSIMTDLIGLARALSADVDILDEYSEEEYTQMTLERYEILLNRLESLRKVDRKKLMAFAEYLKKQEGQKFVLIFYQREFLPQLTPQDFNRLVGSFKVLTLFGYFFRDLLIDIEKVKQIFSDSSITIHFLFLTKPYEHIPGIIMQEHSEDMFVTFREMARATAGITASSSSPEYLFQQASNSIENYYLLYYSPKNYKTDGKFKNIEVKVKEKRYEITHRSGYMAN